MDFVIIGNDWEHGIHNPTSKHRIAIELAKRGSRILWVDGAGMRTPALGSGSDRKRILNKLKLLTRGPRAAAENADLQGKIWVVTPALIPLPEKEWARRWNGRLSRLTGAFWARRLGMKTPALINYLPIFAEAMNGWPGRRIYHCVDRWDAFGTYNSALMAEMDARCCRYAEQVIASSQDLASRCARHNGRVALVLHGVDHEHFSHALAAEKRPADLPPAPVAGFFGLLSEWVDQELLVKLARATPAAQIVLIGKADTNIDALKGIPNIHLLGQRPFRELPKYLGHFAVGLIPFRITELTRAVNPIKLREMLAGGCPVVSTALPEVERYKGLCGAVDVAYNHDEFIGYVQKRLHESVDTTARRDTSASMRAETWSAKVDEILAAVSTGDRG